MPTTRDDATARVAEIPIQLWSLAMNRPVLEGLRLNTPAYVKHARLVNWVAEVAARFTLDAMPGKQMSIDADLNAGVITDTEARERREQIEKEADFYGAMDGASKFVKGDAIAGIVILIVNIVGGFTIGMVIHGMTLSEAANLFTLLSIGDGLVSQIPALLISTATGIVVDVADLRREAVLQRERLDQLVDGNEEHKAMVAQFERLYDASEQQDPVTPPAEGGLELRSGDEIAAEVERFLRDQGKG